MNSLVIVALSMMVALATSTPCSDVCMGSCNLAKANCDAAMVLGPLCGVAYSQCAAGCGAVCGCNDSCDSQCKPDYTACMEGSTGNLILSIQCSAQYDACAGQCQAVCAINTAVSAVSAVLNGGGSGAATRK